MRRAFLFAIAGAVAVLGLACTNAKTPVVNVNNSGPSTGISVSGQGSVTLKPDIAVMNLGVETQASTVKDARIQAQQAMDKLVASLKANGVADDDIQTVRLGVTPRFTTVAGQSTIVGYTFSNTLLVKVRDVSKVNKVLDDASDAAGNLFRTSSFGGSGGISFQVNDPGKAQVQARDRAMDDARAKAEQLAAKAGVKVGKAIAVSEGTFQAVMNVPFGASAAGGRGGGDGGDLTFIAAGETEVSITLQVTFAIE